MNAFSAHFSSLNPGVFRTPDTAYVLAYSVIMLNTDAHNPSVKKKMMESEFIRNNRWEFFFFFFFFFFCFVLFCLF